MCKAYSHTSFARNIATLTNFIITSNVFSLLSNSNNFECGKFEEILKFEKIIQRVVWLKPVQIAI